MANKKGAIEFGFSSILVILILVITLILIIVFVYNMWPGVTGPAEDVTNATLNSQDPDLAIAKMYCYQISDNCGDLSVSDAIDFTAGADNLCGIHIQKICTTLKVGPGNDCFNTANKTYIKNACRDLTA